MFREICCFRRTSANWRLGRSLAPSDAIRTSACPDPCCMVRCFTAASPCLRSSVAFDKHFSRMRCTIFSCSAVSEGVEQSASDWNCPLMVLLKRMFPAAGSKTYSECTLPGDKLEKSFVDLLTIVLLTLLLKK